MTDLRSVLPEKPAAPLILAWCSIGDEEDASLLTEAEHEEYRHFTSGARRREFIYSRGLVRSMSHRLLAGSGTMQITKDALGKPEGQRNGEHFKVSIAHTAHHVLCGISPDIELGVDLEPAGRAIPDRLRRRLMHAAEEEVLAGVSTIRLWTVKEALVKLHGTGLRTNLNDCIITKVQDTLFHAILDDEIGAKICSFNYEDHWMALAWYADGR